jgi:transcriptional regulator with XRE-family HTH domain
MTESLGDAALDGDLVLIEDFDSGVGSAQVSRFILLLSELQMNTEHGGISAEKRGEALKRWRTPLGWGVSDVAKILDVTERTISSWESGVADMPDGRWRLFAHEVLARISAIAAGEEDDQRDVVLLVSSEQAPLDVVSNLNYAGYVISDDGQEGIVASYSISRLTGAPAVHRQRFPVGPNKSVISAFDRWEREAREGSMNLAAFQMERWVMRRVLAGELQNPNLIAKKEAVANASAAVDRAVDAPEEQRQPLMRALDEAIAELMEAVAQATRAAQH